MILELLTLFTLIVATIGTTTTILIFIDKRKTELALLGSLYLQLDLIKETAEGHQTERRNNPKVIPSYYLGTIDADYYLTRLKNRIRRESSTKYVPIIKLKKELGRTKQKVENINHLLSRILDCMVGDLNPRVEEQLKEELWGTNKYYDHLNKLINSVQLEIVKIILPKS